VAGRESRKFARSRACLGDQIGQRAGIDHATTLASSHGAESARLRHRGGELRRGHRAHPGLLDGDGTSDRLREPCREHPLQCGRKALGEP
jgi:hypothetical protein